MKAILKISYMLLACVTLMTACEKGNGLKPEVIDLGREAEPVPIYGAGDAFNWTATAILPTEDNPDLFVFEKELEFDADNKLFKFQLTEGEWNQIEYFVPATVDYSKEGDHYTKLIEAGNTYPMYKCSEMAGTLRDHFWGIPEGEDGTYIITVDAKQLTLKVEKK